MLLVKSVIPGSGLLLGLAAILACTPSTRRLPDPEATSSPVRDDAWVAARTVGASGHRSITAALPPPVFGSR
jgi:hypothetical protein